MQTDATFTLRRMAGALIASAVVLAPGGRVQAQTAIQILTAGCAEDARKFCAGVPAGGGRIMACLKQNKDSLSDKCKQAAAQASAMAAGGPPNAAPAPAPSGFARSSSEASGALVGAPAAPATRAPEAQPAPTAAAAVAAIPSGTPSTVSSPGGSFLVMKKVQITGPGPDAAHPTLPAFDLMIPSTWKIEGGVSFGGSPSGCYADIFAIALRATSADQSTMFAAGPDSSWQYADDPSVLKSLNDPSRRALGAGGKPCPVAKPMTAEEYFRQSILRLYPAGTTVVSVTPSSELDAMVRKRQGLAPGSSDAGATRTEAVRIRLAYQKDGKDREEWVAVAIVVNIYPAGHGSFYDSHATSLVAFSAPKGQLDANDALFRVMVSSMRPEPQWVSYSGGVLTKLYQMQAQKVANIDRQWSQFYAHAAQTINGVTANAMRGADRSVAREDQNIRGVQTFLDPRTGKTQELSNLYDHAWQNGSDDYIMSNDANFNPNDHLSGNWSELKAVSP